MNRAIEREVRRRALGRCEYCLIPESASRLKFPIDHVISLQHRGKTALSNLALCCGACNRHKGPNIAGLDPTNGTFTPLFNPRRNRWSAHFRWRGPIVVGITTIGRTTIAVLDMNHPSIVEVRSSLIAEGLFPFKVQ